MSKYNLLNDESWIRQKYFVEQWSAKRISEFVGCKTSNSVRQALTKFGISIRGYRQAQILGRTDGVIIDDEVLCGTLLGDGCLQKSNRNSDVTSPYFVKKCVKEDYTIHVASLLHNDPQSKIDLSVGLLKHKNKDWEKYHECYVFRTNSSDLLRPYHSTWYPQWNDYKKVVPKSLVLTPRMILYWFLDDGSSTYRKRNEDKLWKEMGWTQKKKQIICSFCSESFTKIENEFLCKQLNKMGLNASVRPINGGIQHRIFVNQSSTNNFFDLIGSCPIDSLKYKWKRIDD